MAIRILLLGAGAREHALARKLAESPLCARLYAAPGNPGIGQVATLVPGLVLTDPESVTAWAAGNDIGLVVIGPEAPLAAGVADRLRAEAIPVFGPSQAAAQLESSKRFTKELCFEAGVPTASYHAFASLDAALLHIHAPHQHFPLVVKANGLAAGKGVTIAASAAEAEEALRQLFAAPGAEVVIEEFLEGEEISFFVLADGTTALPLLAAQDHKQVGDGDTGPNTGGMGAYAPASLFDDWARARVMKEIVDPTLAAMAARGTPFTGVLFCGLMLTKEGPKLIEYNVRFGDPECQVLMALLQSDLAELLLAAATGRLAGHDVRWRDGAAAVVVLAAKGYPGTPRKGGVLRGLAEAERHGATVLQAGTARDAEGRLVARGGRVLAIVGRGENVGAAVARAYEAIDAIDFADGFCRRDIGWREIAREKAAASSGGARGTAR